jgi:cyclopropane-fatty-acyl-phospholipid synthase
MAAVLLFARLSMLEARMISQIEQRLGALPVAVTLWNGRTIAPETAPAVRIAIRSPQALLTFAKPSLGRIAKAYVEGEIDLEGDAHETLRLGEQLVAGEMSLYRRSQKAWKWWRHTRSADRKAIQHHYDVGNDFYALWLDRNRVYSCAYFRKPDDSLDVAQEQKLDHICRKLMLKPGERFLDIGCGWGGLILWAAQRFGVRALGVTLSDEQQAYVSERIRELGLADRCEVRLMDYRDVPEQEPFDKIASVGMFEHVGKRNLPAYFRKIHALLRPGGVVMNHGITTSSLDDGQLGSDLGKFVEEYVFPGGELMHVSHVMREMSSEGLEPWDAECLRPHYAKTLWHWVSRLEANADEARRLAGEKRFRVWRIYMAGAAHAFERGWISIFQILGARPLPDGSLPYPLTRSYIYEDH